MDAERRTGDEEAAVRIYLIDELVEDHHVEPGALIVGPEEDVVDSRREVEHRVGRRRQHERGVARECGEGLGPGQLAVRPRRADVFQRRHADLYRFKGPVAGLRLEREEGLRLVALRPQELDQALERADVVGLHRARDEVRRRRGRRRRGGAGLVGLALRGRVAGRRRGEALQLGEQLRRQGAVRLDRVVEKGAAVREARLDLVQAVLNRLVGLALLVVVADDVAVALVVAGLRKSNPRAREKGGEWGRVREAASRA